MHLVIESTRSRLTSQTEKLQHREIAALANETIELAKTEKFSQDYGALLCDWKRRANLKYKHLLTRMQALEGKYWLSVGKNAKKRDVIVIIVRTEYNGAIAQEINSRVIHKLNKKQAAKLRKTPLKAPSSITKLFVALRDLHKNVKFPKEFYFLSEVYKQGSV